MNIKHKKSGKIGFSNQYNVLATNEIIVYFDDTTDSDFMSDYLFQLADGTWVESSDSRIISDNYNHYFREAQTAEELQKGYYA